jgi:NADH-quinone oxidoreductase subunit J
MVMTRVFRTGGGEVAPGPYTPEAVTAAGGNTRVLSELMFSEYILPFELTSVLLLAGIVGAVAIAKRHTRKGAQDATSSR